MDEKVTPRRSLFAVWHWPRWVLVTLAVLMPLSYPLSIGPAMCLSHRGYISQRSFHAAYDPLERIAAKWPPAGIALYRYCQWWLQVGVGPTE